MQDNLDEWIADLYSRYVNRRISNEEMEIIKNSPSRAYMNDFERMVEEGKTWRTKNGLRVSSLGEVMIAEYLDDKKIAYFYDGTIELFGAWIRPDFRITTPGYGKVIIEYFGMFGDEHYDEKLKKKIEKYNLQKEYYVLPVYNEHLAYLNNYFDKYLIKREEKPLFKHFKKKEIAVSVCKGIEQIIHEEPVKKKSLLGRVADVFRQLFKN